jgi:hypothetical protein
MALPHVVRDVDGAEEDSVLTMECKLVLALGYSAHTIHPVDRKSKTSNFRKVHVPMSNIIDGLLSLTGVASFWRQYHVFEQLDSSGQVRKTTTRLQIFIPAIEIYRSHLSISSAEDDFRLAVFI